MSPNLCVNRVKHPEINSSRLWGEVDHNETVSEPDPRKNRKGGSCKRGGVEVYTVECLGIVLFAEPCKPCWVFCWTRHTYRRSTFPAWCLQLSKTKQNAKTILVRLTFPINTHQDVNQRPIGSAPAYRAQCTLPPHPIYQTLLRRSGSDTTMGHGLCIISTCKNMKT